jgi:hypothetical protein
MEQQKVDLDALEAALAKYSPHCPLDIKFPLPALIAELRELRARTTPEVIGQKHQNRRLWLVCVPEFDGWQEAKWEPTSELWVNYYGGPIFGTPTHALSLPPAPEAP